MNISFHVGDILTSQADGLVCSGNVQLNMSGGVNGTLLQAGGEAMQIELHQYLVQQQIHFVKPGFVMRIGPQPFSFKSIIYTVAIDGFYDSTVKLAETSLTNAFRLLAEDNCQTLAVPAIATGYGHLSKNDFGKALKNCLTNNAWPFTEVTVISRNLHGQEEIKAGFNAT